MRLIDADALDDLICQLNEEGREITRNEYKMIDNILFEFPTVCDLEQIRDEIERKANSGQWSEAVIYGMQKAIAIIDKYTKGAEK